MFGRITSLFRARKTLFSVSNVVEAYKRFLEKYYAEHLTSFLGREESNPVSARAEAVMFSVLWGTGLGPVINEHPGLGGYDFECHRLRRGFAMEVTSLDTRNVSQRSAWPNDPAVDSGSGAFSLVTELVRRAISRKLPQLAGAQLPRVVAVTLEHRGAGVLFGPMAAEAVLVTNTKIEVPLFKPNPEIRVVLDAENDRSVFFRFADNGSIKICRQTISAILLVQIFEDECRMLGVLHPEPHYEFEISMFPEVPFVRLKRWPPENGRLEVEWVIGRPAEKRFYYMPIQEDSYSADVT